MTLTVLGSGTSHGVPVIGCSCQTCCSPDPRDVRSNASILITVRGKNILIDCGRDFHQQALRHRLMRIDYILLTHTHFDHIAGIDDLRVYTMRRGEAIPLFGKEEHLNYLRNFIYHYLFDPEVQQGGGTAQIDLVAVDGRFVLEGLVIEPLTVLHGTMPILGYRIDNFAYLTDVSEIPHETLEKLYGLELFILGALRHTEHPTHFNIYQALQVVSEVRPKRTFFTHICHDVQHEQVEAQFKNPDSPYFTPEEVHLAYDGLRIEL